MSYQFRGENVDWKRYADEAEGLLRKDQWIPVYGEFCYQLEDVVVRCINLARRLEHRHIRLLINSNGGDIEALISIRTTLKMTGLPTIGFVVSRSKSAGFELLQQCNRRLAAEGARLLAHWGSTMMNNNSIAAIMRGETWPVEHIMSVRNTLLQDVVKRTGIEEKVLRGFFDQERVFSAQEALALKLIDEVVTDYSEPTFTIPTN